MAIFYSYSVSIETSKTIGTTISDKTVDGLNSLHQSINNTLPKGSVFKIDVELVSGELQTINLNALGLNKVRSILLKSDRQFGYSLVKPSELAAAEPYWYLVRTAFIDFNISIPTTIDPKYKPSEPLNIIKLEAPLATHPVPTITDPFPVIVVQLIVVLD